MSCLDAAVAPLQEQQKQANPEPDCAERQPGDPAGRERHGDSGEPPGHPGQLVQGLRDTEDGRPVLFPDLVLHRRVERELGQDLSERSGTPDGTGLGLSIVRSVAAAHSGWATARPLPAGGLEVSVSLPGYAG